MRLDRCMPLACAPGKAVHANSISPDLLRRDRNCRQPTGLPPACGAPGARRGRAPRTARGGPGMGREAGGTRRRYGARSAPRGAAAAPVASGTVVDQDVLGDVDVREPELLVEDLDVEVQQHRRRADALAEAGLAGDDEPQRA